VAFDAAAAASVFTGLPETANMMLFGAAVQAGLVPVGIEAIEQAIRLNGIAIDANLAAFAWGRHAAHDPLAFAALLVDVPALSARLAARVRDLGAPNLDDVLIMLAGDLVAYQDDAYADRFLDLIERTVTLHDDELTETVARSYHHLLAYKDEYEVARLMLSPDGLAAATALTNTSRVQWRLHPPILRALGLKNKLKVGSRWRPAIRTLAKGKRLRGGPFDPFGRTHLRRLERELPVEFEEVIATTLEQLDQGQATIEQARSVASLPMAIRGYEDLKLRRIAEYRKLLAVGLNQT